MDQNLTRAIRQSLNKPSINTIVGERQRINGVWIAGSLHKFSYRTEEIVGLLRLKNSLPLGLDKQTIVAAMSLKVDTVRSTPCNVDLPPASS